MSENNVGQPPVKLEDTTSFTTPEGNKIFQQVYYYVVYQNL